MNPSSDHRLDVADEDRLGSVLDNCDCDLAEVLDADGFAARVRRQIRHRHRRRRRYIRGGLSLIALLAVTTVPIWYRIAAFDREKMVPRSAKYEAAAMKIAPAAGDEARKAALRELDLEIRQIRIQVEVLRELKRRVHERRRVRDVASRVVDWTRQQAEISVLSAPAWQTPQSS